MGLPVKEYVIGRQVFEMVDNSARSSISDIQTKINSFISQIEEENNQLKEQIQSAKEQVQSAQKVVDECKSDIEKVKQSTIEPDKSLAVSGTAADSKVVGDEIRDIKAELSDSSNKINDVQTKITNMSVEAQTLSYDSEATASVTDTDTGKHIVFGIPRGKPGVFTLNGKEPDENGEVTLNVDDIGPLIGTQEGSLIVTDASGKLVSSAINVSKLGTGATYSLFENTLTITTL